SGLSERSGSYSPSGQEQERKADGSRKRLNKENLPARGCRAIEAAMSTQPRKNILTFAPPGPSMRPHTNPAAKKPLYSPDLRREPSRPSRLRAFDRTSAVRSAGPRETSLTPRNRHAAVRPR